MTTKNALSSANSSSQQKTFIIIGVIAVIAIVAAVAAIVLSGNSSTTSISASSYAEVTQERRDDGGFVLGNPEAPITIVEFADFMCPHCQDYKSTIDRIIQDFVLTGKARLEYRMLPAVDPTLLSPYTARLVECADTLKPGAFWEAHDVMFDLTSRSKFDDTSARTFAQRVGLDYGALLTCSQDAKQVATDTTLAQQMGVQGTPAVLIRYDDGQLEWIGGRPSRGAPTFEALAVLIEASQ